MRLTPEDAQILVGLMISVRNTAMIELRRDASGDAAAPYPDRARAAYLAAVIDLANRIEHAYQAARSPVAGQFITPAA